MKQTIICVILYSSFSCGLFSCANDTKSNDAKSKECPETTINDCYVGSAFVVCPGDSKIPELYCNNKECRWVTGCVPVEYFGKFDTQCRCQSSSCPHNTIIWEFVMGKGKQPWTRDRYLVLDVYVKKEQRNSSPELVCSGCEGPCAMGDNPCEALIRVRKESPGTEIVLFESSGGIVGWRLEIEVDLKSSPPKGRACRIPYSDYKFCDDGRILCATGGRITINEPNADELKGEFHLQFADGVQLSGLF